MSDLLPYLPIVHQFFDLLLLVVAWGVWRLNNRLLKIEKSLVAVKAELALIRQGVKVVVRG